MSSRIADLRASIESGVTGAVESFWNDVAAEGTPLIEPVAGDPGRMLITFVWRGRDDLAGVAVEGGPGGNAPSPLFRLAGADLWFRSYEAPADARFTYRFRESFAGGATTAVADPLNPRQIDVFDGVERPTAVPAPPSSVVELACAPRQPWAQAYDEVAAGLIDKHPFVSRILGNQRLVWVYTPPGYPDGGPYPSMVAFDGALMVSQTLALPTTLDNLGAAGLVPPMVAVMVSNPNPSTRVRELPCYEPFVDFLGAELVPWLRNHYAVSADASRAIVGGTSHGGLAASFAALRRPDLFTHVLSHSGSYWWKPAGEAEPEWLARLAASAPNPPPRVYLDVGRFETGDSREGAPDTLTCNRHFRDVLMAKGSQVHYAEFSGGHDTICWRGGIAEGLCALTREWKAMSAGSGVTCRND